MNDALTPPAARLAGRATCWPTPDQALLLQAALFDGDRALAAWTEWDARVDVDDLDSGSYRLLPLLHHNLSRLEVHPDYLGRLKGCYRQTWFKNNMLLHRVDALQRQLLERNIESLSLKGFPLAVQFYGDIGLRPMDDYDFLVHPHHAAAVIDMFMQSGWRPGFDIASPATIVGLRHSMGFSRNQFENCDLHWHAMPEFSKESIDAEFWDQAVPFSYKDIEFKTLCATDHLLHTCLHGAGWNAVPPLRWAADACMIMNKSEIHWDRFLSLALRCQAELPLLDGLALLKTTLHRSIPDHVFDALKTRTPSPGEVKAYRELISKPDLKNPGSLLRLNYRRFQKGRSDGPSSMLDFPRYLQWKWQLSGLWQVPFVAVFKTLRSLKRRVL